jgi:hypothetical protein
VLLQTATRQCDDEIGEVNPPQTPLYLFGSIALILTITIFIWSRSAAWDCGDESCSWRMARDDIQKRRDQSGTIASRRYLMNLVLTPPLFGFVVGTRAALAFGMGLLVADRIPESRRRRLALTLISIGVATTVPAAKAILARRVGRRIETGA